MKDVIFDGVKETFQAAAWKGEGTKKQKFFKSLKAYGSLARFGGIGYTMLDRPELYDQGVEKVLDTLDGKTNWSSVGRNYVQNVERYLHYFGGDKEAEAAVTQPGKGAIKGTEDEGVTRMPIPKEEVATGPSDAVAETGKRTFQSPFKVPDKIKEAIEASREEIPPEIKEPLPKDMETPVKYPGGEPQQPIDLEAEEQAAAKTAEEAKGAAVKIGAVAGVSPETPETGYFQIAEKVDIKKGDSIWTVAEKYLKGNKVFQQLSESSDKDTIEALQTYNIDRVKDIIVANPEEYGLLKGVDVDKLTAEQLKNINWEKAFANTFLEDEGLMAGLSEKQVENIVENNKTLREFFKAHPDAPRSSDNYEAVLKGGGVSGKGEVVKESVVAEEVPKRAYNKISIDQVVEKIVTKECGLNQNEWEAIQELKTGRLFDAIPTEESKAWEMWRSGNIPDLPHHGIYGSGEFGRHINLAQFIREKLPLADNSPEVKEMSIKEVLEMIGRDSAEVEGVQEVGPLAEQGEKILESTPEEGIEEISADKISEKMVLKECGLNQNEWWVIRELKTGKLLEAIPTEESKAWEMWRSGNIPDLPHHGIYGSGEFGRHIKLAQLIREELPLADKSSEVKEMNIKEVIKMINSDSTEKSGGGDRIEKSIPGHVDDEIIEDPIPG